jgi:hypothetical protein
MSQAFDRLFSQQPRERLQLASEAEQMLKQLRKRQREIIALQDATQKWAERKAKQ